ncbi:glycoside hydrolase family 18 protein [bacterium]|nr:MAG: glycoside hydrolase family 18 protein [bacterium]
MRLTTTGSRVKGRLGDIMFTSRFSLFVSCGVIVTCVLAACLLDSMPAAQAATPIVMGYYPSYRTTPAPDRMRFDRFTHVIQCFVRANDEGKATLDEGLNPKPLIAAAHAHNSKVLLALGGGAGGEKFGLMVRDKVKRAQFVADVVRIMKANGYDGLALDWEQPTAEDKAITVEFVSQLREQMKAANRASLLVLVVNAFAGNSQGYDGPRLRDNVDFLQVMSYDFHGSWSHAGHHSSLYGTSADRIDGKAMTFQAGLSYWRDVQGFPTQKILMGVAGYGYGFKVKNWGEKATSPSQYPDISFRDARALVGKGWTRYWDAEAHAPFLVSDDKSDRISYEDEMSVADKASWMKKNGLPGFFIWELSQDYVDGDNLLIRAAQNAWSSPTPK